MKIEVNMTVEKTLFEVNHWRASDPVFAIQAFKAQIEAARVIWPEAFAGVTLTVPATPNE